MGDGVRGAGDEARVGVWEGASSESPRVAGAAPTPPAGPQLRVETGKFIACAMPTNNSMSVMVGKVLEVRAEKRGKRCCCAGVFLRITVNANAPRSKYGKGGWTEEFVHVGGTRVPSTSTRWDDVAAVNATFATLTKTHTLPSHV